MENKASQNNEVREYQKGRWAIVGKSNSCIAYYASSKEDAEQTLNEWDAAPELLEVLKDVDSYFYMLWNMDALSVESVIWEQVNQAIKKAEQK